MECLKLVIRKTNIMRQMMFCLNPFVVAETNSFIYLIIFNEIFSNQYDISEILEEDMVFDGN